MVQQEGIRFWVARPEPEPEGLIVLFRWHANLEEAIELRFIQQGVA